MCSALFRALSHLSVSLNPDNGLVRQAGQALVALLPDEEIKEQKG